LAAYKAKTENGGNVMLTGIKFRGYNKPEQNNIYNNSNNLNMPNLKSSSDTVSFSGRTYQLFDNCRQLRELRDFVTKYSLIVDPGEESKDLADLIIVGVKKIGNPDAKEFKKLSKSIIKYMNELPYGSVTSIELTIAMGDRNIALQTMGLGKLLGEWEVGLNPKILNENLPVWDKIRYANNGLLEITNK
jgi:hypothetical protein